jgi:hypothetical protein
MNMKSLPLVLIVLAIAIVGGIVSFNLWSKDRKMNVENGSQAVDQNRRSYQMELTSKSSNIESNKQTKISYKIKNDKGDVLKNYEVVHEKIMHFIVIRKDLQNFLHLHPELNQQTGEFTVNVTFPTDGPYRIFPDFTPSDDNPQKLPVTVYSDINVGVMEKYKAEGALPGNQAQKTFEGYQVTFNMPLNLKSQQELTYSLTIKRNGQEVTDLDNYLGALGHSVILKAESLDFIHTHAGDKPDMNQGAGMGHTSETTVTQNEANRGPRIDFTTTFPSPGVYKIFTQFQHEGKIITTDFVAEAK